MYIQIWFTKLKQGVLWLYVSEVCQLH